jgi:hypothetical protein
MTHDVISSFQQEAKEEICKGTSGKGFTCLKKEKWTLFDCIMGRPAVTIRGQK